MADIQSATAEIRRGKKKEERRTNDRMKIFIFINIALTGSPAVPSPRPRHPGPTVSNKSVPDVGRQRGMHADRISVGPRDDNQREVR